MMAEYEEVVGDRGKVPEVRPPWEKRVELRVEWEGVKGKDEEVNRREALRIMAPMFAADSRFSNIPKLN